MTKFFFFFFLNNKKKISNIILKTLFYLHILKTISKTIYLNKYFIYILYIFYYLQKLELI